MAQKDKVKELVGRGLGSYHTKALQQIDRIEKKNKEQNHKINILTNELDNDYLTKTEEGSVVSLEHSKEGMVYLDELQGNTLVNYCTDGAKELTLNGDIDVEGTSVTLTEGADNGKVDVVCEGNTLVNLINTTIPTYAPAKFDILERSSKELHLRCRVAYESENTYQMFYAKKGMIKPNTTYTLGFFKYDSIPINFIALKHSEISWIDKDKVKKVEDGSYVKYILTTNDNVDSNATPQLVLERARRTLNVNDIIHVDHMVLLEGDWTNKEIPQYFEGMKSVGECENNKFEILSQSNLADIATSGDNANFSIANLKAGKTYTIKSKRDNNSIQYNLMLADPKDVYITRQQLVMGASNDCYTFTTAKDGVLRFNGYSNPLNVSEIMLVEGVYTDSTMPNFKPYSMNKKEILMNEPLRKANDFYRDRFVKIGSKWFIERNTKEVVLDGTQNAIISGTSVKDETLCRFDFTVDGLMKGSGKDKQFICDTLPYLFIHGLDGGSTTVAQECITNHSSDENFLNMVIKKSRLETIDVVGLNKWLRNNNIKIVIPIATPIYEPLEIEPTLSCYTDVTHISNNSLIPCNTKIKNSGYNAIIKPSTLYTVALDTNKSGTIGINLGGAKVTTTNNVATITTPATLTDDSLRLYGKGIKGSKVRLLEGDKTNWIPSHFEGMKSSFEDKLQEDGTFKMEILSNNKNLFDINNPNITENSGQYIRKNNGYFVSSLTQYSPIRFTLKNLKRNTPYTISIKSDNFIDKSSNLQISRYGYADANSSTVHKNATGSSILKFNSDKYEELTFSIYTSSSTPLSNVYIYDIQIEEGDTETEYVSHKSNKIQFSSIEPLRKWDRFVFKDGQLMIERGSYSYIINENSQGSIGNLDVSNNTVMVRYDFLRNNLPKCKERLMGISNVLPNNISNIWSRDVPNASIEDIVNRNGYLDFRIPIANVPKKDYTTAHKWLCDNNTTVVYPLAEPTYEEIPFELQKIILEGYENGTLFIDTNIPPTVTTTYAGETPIVKSVKLNKTEVLNNSNDINNNIVPYLMDMDYRVVCLQLEGGIENVSMARLFGGTFEMLQRDILSKRYSIDEYRYRLDAYLSANKITDDEYTKLGEMLND